MGIYDDAFEKIVINLCKNYVPDLDKDFAKPAHTLSECVLLLRGYGPGDFLENVQYLPYFLDEFTIYFDAVRAIQGDFLKAKSEFYNGSTRYWIKILDFLEWAIEVDNYSKKLIPQQMREKLEGWFHKYTGESPKGIPAAISRELLLSFLIFRAKQTIIR